MATSSVCTEPELGSIQQRFLTETLLVRWTTESRNGFTKTRSPKLQTWSSWGRENEPFWNSYPNTPGGSYSMPIRASSWSSAGPVYSTLSRSLSLVIINPRDEVVNYG